jgi:aminoglycoside phosphotransferase
MESNPLSFELEQEAARVRWSSNHRHAVTLICPRILESMDMISDLHRSMYLLLTSLIP